VACSGIRASGGGGHIGPSAADDNALNLTLAYKASERAGRRGAGEHVSAVPRATHAAAAAAAAGFIYKTD